MIRDTGNIALQVQLLGPQREQVAVLAYLCGLRSGDFTFSTSEVSELFRFLRIPVPSNVSELLRRLARERLVVRGSRSKTWAITPLGEKYVREVFTELDWNLIEQAAVRSPSALFAHEAHLTIPPMFAPPRWEPGINRLLDQYPFEQNVFCMTRYANGPSELPDPVNDVVQVLRCALRDHGLVLHLASDRQVDDELFGNVGAHMWACRYGIGLLEDRVGKDLNYNVVIELGSMLMTGRRCALLKDCTAPSLPTDLVGQIYKSVDFDDLDQVAQEAHNWAANDLGLGRCKQCPSH